MHIKVVCGITLGRITVQHEWVGLPWVRLRFIVKELVGLSVVILGFILQEWAGLEVILQHKNR